jgi:hypothetical protein
MVKLRRNDERLPQTGWVMVDIEDELLRGSIDLHAHGYPEFTTRMRGRVSDVEWAELAAAAGMRAFVIKSHAFPTVYRALHVRRAVPSVDVFGGIALNHPVGGLNPLAVEIAGELGGKVVWMPTWGSKNDLSKSTFYVARLKAYLSTLGTVVPNADAGIEILEGPRLKGVVKEIVRIAGEHRMAVSSGHLSVRESLALVDECTLQNVPFLFTHPFLFTIDASLEDQKEIARRGGYVEQCFITTMPMHQALSITKIVEAVEAVGPERTVLATDAVQTWNPPPPELMRMFIASLLHLGVGREAIRMMTHDNPAGILALDPAGGSESTVMCQERPPPPITLKE